MADGFIKKYFGDRQFWDTALRLALPTALQNLLLNSFSLVDTLMVGQLGDAALSGVGMAGQWSWLMGLVLFGLYSGSSVFISQYWGVNDLKNIRRVYGVMLTHTALVSGVFFAVGLLFPRAVVGIFNDTPAVVEAGASYLSLVCFSYLGSALNGAFGTLLRCTELVRLPMYSGLFSSVLNAVLNYGFIFGKFGLPELGVRGAAAATCISAWAGAVFTLAVSFYYKTPVASPPREVFGFGRDLLFKFYKISTPVILNESLWGLGTFCYNIIFARLGYEYYAAVTIYRTVEGVCFTFFIGLCGACGIMVGKSIGAGYFKQAYEDARRFAVTVPSVSVAVGAAIILLRGHITALFNLTGTLASVTVASAGGILFVYGAELFLRNIPYILIVGVFRSGGDTMSGMKYDLVMVWAVALPLTALAAFVLKLPFIAVFAVMLCAEDIIKVILCIRRFLSKKWMLPVTAKGREAAGEF